MRLSTKSRYGLRILLQIAMDNRDGKAAQGKSISKKQEISEPYLEQIMIPLKNAGLVRTTRGCNGGYFLNKDPKEITILNVIELFEGEFTLVDCVSDGKSCSRIKGCMTSNVWRKIASSLRETADKITLESILEENKDNELEYII
ncbi:MAG: Rrf2 family transcriptional regulator [Lentisphaerae bacterium]|nr:Rrf2 family transcriptional regulator [Lentisphaerota bacterium]